ncbi:MAG: LamG-like jellyroll fold domain-containing protein [Sedimentisphaerales bacterium]|jgi:hypothetical protein|nr:LamG-like jellyroll fold domain-containing protein [Sedimentisphaerales bacterium]
MCKNLSRAIALVLVLSLAGGAWADLVGHWRFDEGAGTVARDSSASGNNGTLSGDVEWVPGQIGGALQFNEGGWVDCGDILTLTEQFTITCWVNPAILSGDRGFVTREGAYAFKSFDTVARFTTPGILDYNANNTILELNTWQHVAVTFVPNQTEGCVFYLNGVATDRLDSTGVNAGAGPFRMGNNQWSQLYSGMMDDVRVFDHILTPEEVLQSMKGAGPELAVDPSPESEATDVPRDVILSWTAGKFAATHDVYFGTSFEDVNDAARSNAMGVLVSQGQAPTDYDPAGMLDFETTYYWRVDEVNAAPDNTIFKGEVWSFTTEPFAYAIQAVTATTSGISDPGAGPENTVNGSGLDDLDQHSTVSDDMWVAKAPEEGPLWIQYEFDRVYKLHQLLVWNYNVQFEAMLGFGIKDATIEYSVDGAEWMSLGDVQLNQATASATYTYNTTVDLAGVAAKFVRLTVNSGFGGLGQYGLSEVRFMQIPAQAREPQPGDGQTDVDVNAALSWRAGREAVTHEVYFGTDPNALALAGTVGAPTFDPAALALGTTYYWQISEVNEAEAISAWQSDLWSFSTQAYIVVDDFESYTDDIDAGEAIFDTWLDGWVNNTGSTVGHLQTPFAEQTIVRSGGQSMPLSYDNTTATVSEADFALDGDWTSNGIKSLSLYFQGAAGNTGKLYVKINGVKVPYDGAADDIAEGQWLPWNIDLSAVGTNLQRVTSLTIGVEGAGATGVVYIDDVRLYPHTPEFVVPVEPDQAGLVAHYAFEGNLNDSVGSHHGTALGNAQTTSDPARGQVLTVDGTGDAVDIAYSEALNPEAFTASVWANPDPTGSEHRSPLTSRDDTPQRGYILYLTPTNTWEFWTGTGTGWNGTAGPAAQLGEWTHIVATFANEQKALYINGRLVGEGTAPLSLNTQRPLRIGGGATEGAGNYFFRGMLDEVRIYNRALSAEEVAGLAGHTEPLHKSF